MKLTYILHPPSNYYGTSYGTVIGQYLVNMCDIPIVQAMNIRELKIHQVP